MEKIWAKKINSFLPFFNYGNGKNKEKMAGTCSMQQIGKRSAYIRPIVFVNLNGKYGEHKRRY
jgi:hypothetical protein